MLESIESRVHTARTHLAAALDWNTQAIEPGLVDWAVRHRHASADAAVRAAFTLLDSCWSVCDDCGDRLWLDLLGYSPKAGKALCPPCWQKADNWEPSDQDRENAHNAHWDRVERERRALKDAGRNQ